MALTLAYSDLMRFFKSYPPIINLLLIFTLLIELIGVCGCASDYPVNGAASISPDQKIAGSFVFGLPDLAMNPYDTKYFAGGIMSWRDSYYQADATMSVYPEEGDITIIRRWDVLYSQYSHGYELASGHHHIHLHGKYQKIPPSVITLREIFQKWIVFAGDDMSRLESVTTPEGKRILRYKANLPDNAYPVENRN